MCEEALQVFSRTRIFEGEEDMEFAESEPDPPENHVVLNSDVIRSIWFRPCDCIMAWGGTSTRLERDMSYWTENFLYNTYVMGS